MTRKDKRWVIKVVVIIAIIVVLIGLWRIASGLVSRVIIDKGDIGYEESETRKDIVFLPEAEGESEVVYPEGAPKYKEVESMFNEEGISERSKSFLGDNYSTYESVITQIKAIGEPIIAGLGKNNFTGQDCVDFDIAHGYDIGLADGRFFDAYNFFIVEMLTVIDVFGDDIAICAVNYPDNPANEIVVVDFSDTLVNENVTKVFDIGDIMSVKGSQDCYGYRKIGDFHVLFMKAD